MAICCKEWNIADVMWMPLQTITVGVIIKHWYATHNFHTRKESDGRNSRHTINSRFKQVGQPFGSCDPMQIGIETTRHTGDK